MRLAPVSMFFANDAEALWRFAADSTRTTHGAAEAIACSRLFAWQLREALRGASREALLAPNFPGHIDEPAVVALAAGTWRSKTVAQIRGSGYCVESLEAALWCFAHTDSFEAAVLAAANLGDDADTTAAIVGQIAGAWYGMTGIPKSWVGKLYMVEEVTRLAQSLAGGRAGYYEPDIKAQSKTLRPQ